MRHAELLPARTGKIKRRLTVIDNDGGYNAEGRIPGQEGEHVWLFLHKGKGPVAVLSALGELVLDRVRLESLNPELRGLIPAELKFYAFRRVSYMWTQWNGGSRQ